MITREQAEGEGVGRSLPEEGKCGEPMMENATRFVDSKPGTITADFVFFSSSSLYSIRINLGPKLSTTTVVVEHMYRAHQACNALVVVVWFCC